MNVDEVTIATLITFKEGERLFYVAEEDGLDQQAVENAYENAKHEYERLAESNNQELNEVAKKLQGIKFKVGIEYVSTLWEMWDSFVDNAVPFVGASRENSGEVVDIKVIDSYGYSDREKEKFAFDKSKDGDEEFREVLNFIFGEIGVSEEEAIEAATKLFFSEIVSGRITRIIDIYSRVGNIMDIREIMNNPEAEFSEYDILEERRANHLDQILFLPPEKFEEWAGSNNWWAILESSFNVSDRIQVRSQTTGLALW